MILKDTSRFQEAWLTFVKTGSYCSYTKDSYAYKEFWLREDDRCRNGYKINDLWIPGTYYFYLNYYPILARDEKTGRKSRICPRFTDVDLEYFLIFERARKEQKGIILAKPRRTGFSFKNSSLAVHEYNFYKEAKCVIGAYLSDLSTNTMSMCIDGLNWLDKHTEWKKQRNPDTRTFVKARFKESIDGIDVWKGYNSQIEVVTFKDNPFASIGKCLAKGTKVLMYDGRFKNVEDVVVGDRLMGIDSTPRTVLNTTSGFDDMYEIQQLRGINYTVNSQHKLYLEQRCNSNCVKDDGIKILTPKEFLELPKYKQEYTHGIKAEAIEFSKKETLIDSYMIGMWLGDGTSAKTQITSNDSEVIEYIYNFAFEAGLSVCHDNKFGYTISQKDNGKTRQGNYFRNALKSLNLFNNKHIPDSYKYNSIEERLKLLAGLIDSDGYKIKDSYCEITQINKTLAEDIVFLTRSLGFYTSMSIERAMLKGIDCGEKYRIIFTGDLSVIPTLIERKKFNKSKTRTNSKRTSIKIIPKGVGEYYGFELSGDHLFMLEDFTITHNSANLFIFEEGGKFPNLIESYNISEPCWRDGEDMIGIPIIYGCVCEGTKVWTKEGKLINIENLTKEDGLLGYNGTEIVSQTINWFKPPAKKECYRITTTSGEIIECSDDHPLLITRRNFYKNKNNKRIKRALYQEAKHIQVKDQILLPSKIDKFGTKNISYARELGLMIGDGNYSKNSTPTLSCSEDEILQYLESKYKKLKYSKHYQINEYKNYYQLSLPFLKKYLTKHGLFGQVKFNKRLPSDIHIFDKESVANLIAGYFDADGNVYYNKKKNLVRIVLTSVVKELLEEVKYQLHKFGIHCNIIKENRNQIPSEEYKGQQNYIYRLYITQQQDLQLFKDNIHLLINKKRDNLKYIKDSKYKINNCLFEINPLNNKEGYFNSELLTDLRYKTVSKIEYIGKKDVYNLNCGPNHNYISNGFITRQTGGSMEHGTVEFAEMFYNPEKYNLLAFDNIWDDDKVGTKCGWFLPANRMRFGKFEHEGKTVELVDKNGNSNIEAATASIMKLRELKSKSGVDKDYRDTITQFPLKPSEAFLRSGYNKFPVAELQQVLSKIESTKSYEYDEKYIELFFDPKHPRGVNYNILHNAKPLVEYPVKELNKEGCLIVYEFPIELPDGTIPPELYMISHDPTKNDEGESLAGIQVFKTHKYYNLYGHDEVVAEFHGRRSKDEINEILEKLSMWYGISNKMLFFENAVGNTKEYFERKKKLHYLCTQPQTIFNKKAAFSSSGNLIYGYPMSNQYIKAEGEDYLKDWLLEDRDKAKGIKNLHLLKSRMLLKQLISYNREGNFDAVMTAIGWASGRRERFNVYEKEKENENRKNKLDFLINNKKIFKNGIKSLGFRGEESTISED